MINENMENTVEQYINDSALSFKTKEEYLTWRKEWKAQYNELSKMIRKIRHMLKTVNRKDELCLMGEDYVFLKQHKIVTRKIQNSWEVYYALDNATAFARRLICQLIAVREIHKKAIKLDNVA